MRHQGPPTILLSVDVWHSRMRLKFTCTGDAKADKEPNCAQGIDFWT